MIWTIGVVAVSLSQPGNAMPDLALDEDQGRDITAYLYTLR